ncbi:hypothetical protein D3C84_930020 [compost metagenome]
MIDTSVFVNLPTGIFMTRTRTSFTLRRTSVVFVCSDSVNDCCGPRTTGCDFDSVIARSSQPGSETANTSHDLSSSNSTHPDSS